MPKTLLLDTDIDTDCDDAGALAVLHALMDVGECDLCGVVCSVPVPTCPTAVAAINAGYQRPDIPVGLVPVSGFETGPRWAMYRGHRTRFARGEFGILPYHDALAATLWHAPPQPEEAVSLYRRLLAAAPDGSVTVCAVGTLTALAQLLDSGPDRHSPLSGLDLARAKVAELVTMAVVAFPEGDEEFNWLMDYGAAARVANEWPGLLTVSSAGHTVLTGSRFMEAAPDGHPVREAYRACLGGLDRVRPSWDLIAALYAVRGTSGPFALSSEYGLSADPGTRRHRWLDPRPEGAPPRRFVTPTLPDTALAAELEDWMIASLGGAR